MAARRPEDRSGACGGDAGEVGGRLRPQLEPRRTDPMTAEPPSDAGDARSGGRRAEPGAVEPRPLFSLSLDEMRAARDERERRGAAEAADAARRERERRAGDRGRFDARGLTDA